MIQYNQCTLANCPCVDPMWKTQESLIASRKAIGQGAITSTTKTERDGREIQIQSASTDREWWDGGRNAARSLEEMVRSSWMLLLASSHERFLPVVWERGREDEQQHSHYHCDHNACEHTSAQFLRLRPRTRVCAPRQGVRARCRRWRAGRRRG